MSITRTQTARQLMEMGGEALQAGAPEIQLEGNQIPQREEMASMPDLDAELYQLFMDALKKREIPPGTTFDMYKEIIMDLTSKQEMMAPERENAAYGGIMGLDGRRQYGFGSFVRSISRAITKPVKKAVSTVKKVAKSPIGKAALAYAVYAAAPAIATRFGGANAPVGSFMNQLASGNRLAAFKTLLPGGTTPGGGISSLNFLSKKAPEIVTSNLGIGSDAAAQAANVGSSLILDTVKKEVPKTLAQKVLSSSSLKYAIPLVGGAAAGAATAMQPEQDIDAEIASVDRGDDFAKKLQAIIDAKGGYQRFGLNPEFAQSAADGGRIGFALGGSDDEYFEIFEKANPDFKGIDRKSPYYEIYFDQFFNQSKDPSKKEGIMMVSEPGPKDDYDDIARQLFGKGYKDLTPKEMELMQEELERLTNKFRGANGGTPGKKAFKYRDKPYGPFKKKTKKAAEGGLMSLGGNEMDLRGGGFVPLGAKEKADDVPARLSKNEFVFTADAVRAAGGGDVDKGADKMYRTMKRLEGVVA